MSEKIKHTLSNCTQCFEVHKDHQCSFPLKPIYYPKPVINVDKEASQHQGVKTFTTSVLAELNKVYTDEVNSSFTDALLQNKSLRLERKKTSTEKRKEKRELHRDVTKKVTKSFAEKAAITMLAEGESKRMYHRKRIAQSFCSPEGPPTAKKPKSHSPDFSKVAWDTASLQATLENWPRDTIINWSAVGREHGITGGNAGQVVKEFAKSRDIHLFTPKRKPTKRPCKIKLPGTSISIPANPTVRSIEVEIQDMIP